MTDKEGVPCHTRYITGRTIRNKIRKALIVVSINVLLVWLPIVAHLVAPEPTERRLKAFNAWLRAHGSRVLAVVFVVGGAIMVFDGVYGLVVVG